MMNRRTSFFLGRLALMPRGRTRARTPLFSCLPPRSVEVTLRAITVLVLFAVLLAVVAACGSKNASSPSGAELAYSDSEARGQDRGIFLIDREGKHRRRLLRRVQIPDAQHVHWSPTSDLILFQSISGEIW